MRKSIGFVLMLSMAVLFAACGTTGNDAKSGRPQEKTKNLSDREIIAELKQTVTETPKRDAAVKKQQENDDFNTGVDDEPSEEKQADMAVQVEAHAVLDAVEEVYGSYEAFRKEGVLFPENQAEGAKQSAIWIGLKAPDERLDELLEILQLKVDAGEILAKPIYFFKSDYTEMDLENLPEQVLKVLKPMNSENGSFSIGTDIKTGNIEITHDFLKEEQQAELKKQFPDHIIHFEQQGRLIAEPGEPTTTYPDQQFTTTPSTEGSYVMQIDKGEMLVIDTMPRDFGATGGAEDFYDAVIYKYPSAAEDLKVGQRIKVEDIGFILESYPGQGSAKYVEVLPEYKPKNAVLSESAIIVKAIDMEKKKSDGMVIIRSIVFDEKTASWTVGVKQSGTGEGGEDQAYEFTIIDE